MFDRITNRHIILFNITLVAIINAIKGIVYNWHYIRFLIYVCPFIIVFVIYLLSKNLKCDPITFFIGGILCILAGNWGNLSAMTFFIFAFYCMDYDVKIILILFGLIILTVILKFRFLLRDGDMLDAIQYCIGLEFCFAIYFNMIHPKDPIIINEDEINRKILIFLIKGYRTKEIADKIHISVNAVIKRIAGMREKYNAGNNEQLIYNIVKNVKIGLI